MFIIKCIPCLHINMDGLKCDSQLQNCTLHAGARRRDVATPTCGPFLAFPTTAYIFYFLAAFSLPSSFFFSYVFYAPSVLFRWLNNAELHFLWTPRGVCVMSANGLWGGYRVVGWMGCLRGTSPLSL